MTTIATTESLCDLLAELDACNEAREWVASQESARAAWDACEHGDWLLWIAEHRGVDRKLLTRGACACARTSLQYVPPGELRPLRAIEAAEAWTRGEASSEELATARATAWAATRAATRAAAWAAASAAASAAGWAAKATAWDAMWNAARDAASAASAAASAAAWNAARNAALKQCADLVRGIIRFEDIEEIKREEPKSC